MKCFKWMFLFCTLVFISHEAEAQIEPDCEAIGITDPVGFTTNLVPAVVFPGDAFCVQFSTDNFESIIAFQYTFNFDPTELCYDSFFAENGTLTGQLAANDTQVNAGILTFIWSNLNAEGQSFTDGTLIFTVCFTACGEPNDCYELGFNNELAEFPDIEVNYQVNDLESCTSDILLLDGGSSTCIEVACSELTIIDLAVCNTTSNTGSIDFRLCGGTAPYVYEIATSNFTVVRDTIFNPFESPIGLLANFPPMNYTLNITDANGGMISRPIIIDNIDPVTYDPVIVTNPVCSNTTNGSIQINNIVSGIPGELFDINFSNGITFQDVNDAELTRLVNGEYMFTITDATGCETVDIVEVFTPPLEIMVETTAASCPGSDDGFLMVTVTGGTPFAGDEYLINGIQTTSLSTTTPFLDPEYSSLTDSYRLRIEDANGCRLDDDIVIPVLSEIEIDITGVEDISCKGDCDGSFQLEVLDPPGNYAFLVRDENFNFVTNLGSINGTILIADSVLCAGTYSIVIEDFSTGCMKDTFITINEPPEELLVSFITNTASCSGPDGEITANVTGGMMPYQFNWEADPSNTTNQLSDIGTGTYNVTITDDLGCVIDTSITIDSDNVLEIDAFIETNISCDGTTPGVLNIDILASSSSDNPTFEWQDINGSPLANTQSLTFNSPGDYIIIVTTTDNNCEATDTVNIPVELGLTLEFGIQDTECAESENGSINVINIQGGQPPYECQWEDGSITSCNPMNLMAGTYNLTVVDLNGCSLDTFATVTVEPTDFTFDIIQTNVTCPSGSDGSVNIDNITGGTGPYQCIWEDNSVFTCNPSNLSAGIYNFAIIDNNNCSKDTFVQIFAPTQNITFDLDINNPSCSGDLGVICVNNLDGANLPIDIAWSDSSLSGIKAEDLIAGDYTISFTDARNCTTDTTVTLINTSTDLIIDINVVFPSCATGISDGAISFPGFDSVNGTCEWGDPTLDAQNCTLTQLAPGFYNVTLTDANGCQKDTFIDLTITDTLQVAVSNVIGALCFETPSGQATAEITNDPLNVGNYNFLWSNPADDGSGLTDDATQLLPGENFVIASNGTCATDTLFFTIDQPSAVMLDFSNVVITNTDCKGECNGSIALFGTGGNVVGDYTYLWEDGNTDQTRMDLCAGEYNVTVFDDNNCEGTGLISIAEPDTLIVRVDSMSVIQLDCTNQNIAAIPVIASGGCGNYEYQWADNVSTTSLASDLGPGIYTVTVVDDCGCTAETSYELVGTSELMATALPFENPKCQTDKTCIGIESALGGTNMNFTYSINFGERLPIDSCVMVGPGIYTLLVFDSAGCSIELTVDVQNPDPFSVSLGNDITFELGQDAAELTAVTTGGTPEFSFMWFSGSEFSCVGDSCQSISITPTSFTTYEVIVTDANGCTSKDEILVDIKTERNVYIANIFNPFALPPNDKFIPLTGVGVEEMISFRIYDRWGNLMHDAQNLRAPLNIDDGWDGRRGNGPNNKVVPGVYVYTATIRFIDGAEQVYSGEVTVIR